MTTVTPTHHPKIKRFAPMTTLTSSRSLAALVATLALGTFAAVALAGPGPQYWSKSSSKPASPPSAPSAATCGGCSDTVQWKISDRGPSGKGVSGASVASRTHGCTSCSGEILTSSGQTKDAMTRAATCGTIVCCK
jgi:hypothetical protein